MFSSNNKLKKIKPAVKPFPVNEAILEMKKTEFLNWLKENDFKNYDPKKN